MELRPGLHLVHKRAGETSFSHVQRMLDAIADRGLTRQLPVVHGGALDPFAEGLLILLVGQATQLAELIHEAPKRYIAELAWGLETDTGDPGGAVVSRGDPGQLTAARLDEQLRQFVGWHEQVPPATSNKRVDGERAYAKAHRGESFTLKPSRVYLHEAQWLGHNLPLASRVELTCRGGYYVRSLARDLGRAVGVPAHLAKLERIQIGPWRDPGAEPELVLGRELVPWLPSRELTDDEAIALELGKTIPAAAIAQPTWSLADYPMPTTPIRALHHERLVALLEPRGDALAARVHLKAGL